MNQHINQELMWKSQNLQQSSESIVRSAPDSMRSDRDGELADFININTSSEIYDCSANDSSYDDRSYQSADKVSTDRSISNASFNQFNTTLIPLSKVKEYKNFNDVEPGSFNDGIYVHNNNDPSISKMRCNSDQTIADEYIWFYLDPRNVLQGPFLDSQMFQWWSQGIYFQNSLLMKRKCDANFSTLQDYSKRFNGVPFNRKDIRVPPLTDSLSLQSSNQCYMEPKLYTNGPIGPIHRTNQQVPAMNDQNYLLQLMSSAPNQSQEELSKLLHKVSLQQRIPPPQTGYEQSLVTAVQNGSDSFLNSGGSGSLSNFVNLRLNNTASQSQAYNPDVSKPGHMANYMKNERFPSSSWSQMQQTKLTDSVWTSTTDDSVHPDVHVWSRSTNEPVAGGPSLLNSIFHSDNQQKHAIISNNSHKSNPMQETWDNLDPAIIKIVPLGDQSNLSVDSKQTKDNISTNQMEQQRAHNMCQNSSDSVKHPWAELVRKSHNNSVGDQKSTSEFSNENDFINHSTSPNQHKTSMTSNSSDEYDRTACESSDKDLDSLIKWSKTYLENKPGTVELDIVTLIELLIYVESPYELEATMRENVPQFDNICEFVKIFVEKRRPLRQKLFSDNPKKKNNSQSASSSTSLRIDNDEDTKWQTKSKSHGSCKKKKKNNTKN